MWKNFTLGILLFGIAILGPLVAYAGITVIYPTSQITASIDTTPPIRFYTGADWDVSRNAGFVTGWSSTNYNATFNLTFNGLSGANVTIDELVNVSVDDSTSGVNTWKVQLTNSASGDTLNVITALKIRVWEGPIGTPPTADNDPLVCAYLSLTGAVDSESTQPGANTCDDDAHLQFQMILGDGASGNATVAIRPSSITFG